MNVSQEREDEDDAGPEDEFEYRLQQVVGRPMVTPPATILDRLGVFLIVAVLGLMCWLILRGMYLAIRELWGILW